MPNYMCVTCGTQYPESDQPPAHCPICEDERQYVNPNGQQWTTLEALLPDHHDGDRAGRAAPVSPQAGAESRHRAVCPSGADAGRQRPVGLRAVHRRRRRSRRSTRWAASARLRFRTRISIPSMVEWSRAFNDAPIYIHAGNRRGCGARRRRRSVYWEGETQPLWDGVTLVHCGGHFDGSAVLHWRDGADGRGVLLTARHDRHRAGYALGDVHVQLPEPDPAARVESPADRGGGRAVRL